MEMDRILSEVIDSRPSPSLDESEELDSCLVIDEIGPHSETTSETDKGSD